MPLAWWHAVTLVLRSRRGRKLAIWVGGGIVAALVALILIPLVIITSTLGVCMNSYEQTEETGFPQSQPSGKALSDIPEHYLDEYREAAEEEGLDWAVLAAVGEIETGHGEGGKKTTCINSSAGAQGPMQFMPKTWANSGVDANGDGKKDPCYYEDAIHAAASYLKDSGAPEDYHDALYAYNHAEWYVDDVLAQAEKYRGQAEGGSTGGESTAPSTTPDQASSGGGVVEMERLYQGGTGDPPSGWDAVDSQGELDYNLQQTRYADVFREAAEEWNALGGVEIKETSDPADTDIYVKDGYLSGLNGKAAGYTTIDSITFDPDDMEGPGRGRDYQKTIAVHEIGHALGFPHSMGTGAESIMNYNTMYSYTAPTPYDVELYHKVWGGSGDSSGETADGGSGSGEGGEGASASMPAYCKVFGVINIAGKAWDFVSGPDGPGPNASYDGDVPPPDATYTTDNGFKLKPPASQATPIIEEKFDPLSVETYKGHGSGNDASLAVDFEVAPYGEKATGSQKEKGDAIAEFAEKNYDSLHIKSIIWDARIYTESGWGPYTEEMARDYQARNPIVADVPYNSYMHLDHVHIQFDTSGEPIKSTAGDGGGKEDESGDGGIGAHWPPSKEGEFEGEDMDMVVEATHDAGVPEEWAQSDGTWNILWAESNSTPDHIACEAANPPAYGPWQMQTQTGTSYGMSADSSCAEKLRAGFEYVEEQYGSPKAAWDYWQGYLRGEHPNKTY